LFVYSTFFRNVAESVNVAIEFFQLILLFRKCTENVNVGTKTNRIFKIIRKIQEVLTLMDNQYYSVMFIRPLKENVQITDIFSNLGAFIRSLRINAGIMAETSHEAEYKRFANDSVNPAGAVFRGLLLLVRIFSRIVIRDYILRRFLVAKEDFKLKSVICRELKLDSKID